MRLGHAHTEQSRAAISDSMKGRKKSDETRQRMAFAASVRWAKERQRRKAVKAINEGGLLVDVNEPRAISETHIEGTK